VLVSTFREIPLYDRWEGCIPEHRGLKHADRQSFVAEISQRYGTRLRRFLSARLRNASDVPDLAQEVFLRLLRVPHHESIRSPEAYLLTVASHVLYQHRVSQSAIPETLDISEVFTELHALNADSPESRAEVTQRLEDLQRALKELPARECSALLLHRFDGYSIQEIASKLGVARPTAKKYLAKALAHCRAATDPPGMEKS
jgi:RNA polymerase sigma-70 factor (ECF subfamily)